MIARTAMMILLLAAASNARAQSEIFGFVDDPSLVPGNAVIIDSRNGAACEDGAPSRGGQPARCLPLARFFGPHGRLASFRDIDWVFGTVGLTGAEHVLVVGDRQNDRDAVAALIHIAGQSKVSVWRKPIADLGDTFETVPGISGDPARTAVYQAPMRDGRIVLRDELGAALTAGGVLLLDGRPGAYYWGEKSLGTRGGHIAGAQSLPLRKLRAGAALIVPQDGEPVLHGHAAADGLAYYTAVVAGRGQPARLYAGGFTEWAANGHALDGESVLPTAAAPHRPETPRAAEVKPFNMNAVGVSAALGVILGAIATAGAFTIARRGKT